MGRVTRLDRVFIFRNMLSFLIPHEWIETAEGDNYLYCQPKTDSGWLFLIRSFSIVFTTKKHSRWSN
jgi:hypothetical protein